jgi:hypothetical protein
VLVPNDDSSGQWDEDQFRFDLAMGRTRQISERMLERLRNLHEQFPSPELEEAIRSLERWHGRQPPETPD